MRAPIDLSLLPPPQVVEELSFEIIFGEMKATLLSLLPEEERAQVSATLALESEPITKLLQTAAYRELNLRQRINEAAMAVMLAQAVGGDLDQLGAGKNIQRLQISAGDPEAVPPIPPVMESDTDFRKRIQISPEGYTTAGSTGSYVFHGLSAHPDVKDIRVSSPAPGQVQIYVLSRAGNGSASPALISAVDAALNAELTRPVNDLVLVDSAEIINFTVEAKIFVRGGPDSSVIKDAAVAAISEYVEDRRRIGALVSVSGIYSALQRPGVEYVELTAPLADIITAGNQAPYCTGFVIESEVYQ